MFIIKKSRLKGNCILRTKGERWYIVECPLNQKGYFGNVTNMMLWLTEYYGNFKKSTLPEDVQYIKDFIHESHNS